MAGDPILIYTTMKNEGPYMLEWVAYHKSLGVDQFLIFTNDCTDGTDAIAERLTELGVAIHVDNAVAPGGSPQNQMLRRVRRHKAFKRAGWTFCLDVDEFLNIRILGAGVPELIAKLEEVSGGPIDVASFAWKLFGCGGIETFEDRPVTQQFFMCDDEVTPYSGVAQGFKSITRNNGTFPRYGPHRPKGASDDIAPRLRWSDGSGQLMPYETVSWRARPGFGHEFARLHHYVVRSVDGFLVKRDRGKTNHVNHDQAETYWNNMNANLCEDRTILPAVERAEIVRLELMADPALSELHEAAVAWHKAKISELRARDDWQEFRDFLKANLTHRAASTKAGGGVSA
ncbi:Glycosyl transferase family 2 [Cognatiyoonia sediminum]|uniref:Glycosyl transferase family 2 n=1 Tax=Cognatiyoonia sediminum TaxID=1508389 RepID=A0A1M5QV93_9RHOB|nr:glycosyltransferase family 2 protein [Cognatiyoonia sediminum]SHH17660.1 Glycosyl transferase family 2 [Cognatiyoonia sediminum]